MHPSTITGPDVKSHRGLRAVPERQPSHPRKPEWKRQIAIWSRWLHVYFSMVSFAILFFFAVTGLTLNHQQWFASQQKTAQFKGRMDTKWLHGEGADGMAKLEVVEYLRKTHKISSAVNEFRLDSSQCSISFKGPGYEANVFIDRDNGNYDVTETRMGLAAVLNDLHKGRDSGTAWGWVIDASAVFMTFVSVSGIVLLLFLQKRRFSGFTAGLVGAALCYVIYLLWVP